MARTAWGGTLRRPGEPGPVGGAPADPHVCSVRHAHDQQDVAHTKTLTLDLRRNKSAVASSPMEDADKVFAALARSRFRRQFRLIGRDRRYLADKGLAVVLQHA